MAEFTFTIDPLLLWGAACGFLLSIGSIAYAAYMLGRVDGYTKALDAFGRDLAISTAIGEEFVEQL
jgi:hypothetical protein